MNTSFPQVSRGSLRRRKFSGAACFLTGPRAEGAVAGAHALGSTAEGWGDGQGAGTPEPRAPGLGFGIPGRAQVWASCVWGHEATRIPSVKWEH